MVKPKNVSLKKRIIILLLVLLLPLVLVLNAYALYINISYSTQVANLNEVYLTNYTQRVADNLVATQVALDDIVGNSFDFQSLRYKLTDLEAYNRAYTVNSQLKSLVGSLSNIAGMALYSGENGQFMPAWGTADPQAKSEMRSYIQSWDKQTWKQHPGDWKVVEFAGASYLCLVLYHDAKTESTYDVHLFCFVSLDELAESGEQIVAYTMDGQYLTSRALAEENHLPVPQPGGQIRAAGTPQRYMLLSQPLAGTAVDALYLIPTTQYFAGVGPLQLLLLVISLLAVALVPIGFWWIKRALFLPMDGLVTAMETAAGGDLAVRAPTNYRDQEFRTMSATFNSMLEQIQTLKIESYEQELAAKQARLSFLQMQIRPHFYLNCMKNLYGMAQDRQVDKMQEMLVLLSNYLRYMMDSDTEWVSLEQEVENSCNYIRLQQFNQAYPPDYKLSIDTSMMKVRIPPIILLTFVENSVKHAAPNGQLVISLKARRLLSEDGDLLLLSIQDNGQGLSPDMLERLNRLETQPLEGGHVGINNVWQRLKLLYGEGCALVFSNMQGALVEIFLPIGESDDPVDC